MNSFRKIVLIFLLFQVLITFYSCSSDLSFPQESKTLSVGNEKFYFLTDNENDYKFHQNTFENVDNDKKECEVRYYNCKRGSWALYVVEILIIVALGIRIGAISTWCGGYSGVILGAVCWIGATIHLDSMLEECKYQYENCLKENFIFYKEILIANIINGVVLMFVWGNIILLGRKKKEIPLYMKILGVANWAILLFLCGCLYVVLV